MASSDKRFKDNAEKRGGGQFIAMPMAVLRSEAWAKTGAWGVRLMLDLAAQYNGKNNGDLCMAWSVMQNRGWKSKDTLNRAKKELLSKKWILVTRKGGRKVASLYALTFLAIDECGGKLDPKIHPSDTPKGSWKIGNTPPDIVKERAKEKARKIKITGTATVPIT